MIERSGFFLSLSIDLTFSISNSRSINPVLSIYHCLSLHITTSARGFKFEFSIGDCPRMCQGHGYGFLALSFSKFLFISIFLFLSQFSLLYLRRYCFNNTCRCDAGFTGVDCSTTGIWEVRERGSGGGRRNVKGMRSTEAETLGRNECRESTIERERERDSKVFFLSV